MSKRYREPLADVVTPDEGGGAPTRSVPAEVATAGGVAVLTREVAAPVATRPAEVDQPLAFTWRERRYVVTRILGHWREEAGWWRRPDGEPIRIEQTDLWRLEARTPAAMAGESTGVYEVSRRGTSWRLDRIWD